MTVKIISIDRTKRSITFDFDNKTYTIEGLGVNTRAELIEYLKAFISTLPKPEPEFLPDVVEGDILDLITGASNTNVSL